MSNRIRTENRLEKTKTLALFQNVKQRVADDLESDGSITEETETGFKLIIWLCCK
jgi:hypothetical protein